MTSPTTAPIRPSAVAALALLLAAACSRAAAADPRDLAGTLSVTGSSTCAPAVLELAKEFERQHPGARIEVQTGGSSRGLADVRRGTAEVGMVSRDLTPEEAAEVRAWPFARDGVCVIVNARNPVAALSDDELRRIYRGEVGSWAELGGDDAPVTAVDKAAGRATRDVFLTYLGLAPDEARGDVVIGDNEQGIKTVAQDRNAVGYVSVGAAEQALRAGAALRLLPCRGVPAGTAELAAGRYPMARSLNLVTAGEPSPLAAAFLAHCRSAAAAPFVEALGFVPWAGEVP